MWETLVSLCVVIIHLPMNVVWVTLPMILLSRSFLGHRHLGGIGARVLSASATAINCFLLMICSHWGWYCKAVVYQSFLSLLPKQATSLLSSNSGRIDRSNFLNCESPTPAHALSDHTRSLAPLPMDAERCFAGSEEEGVSKERTYDDGRRL